MDRLEIAMGLIAEAGDSRSYCMEAIDTARAGNFYEARVLIEKAVSAMLQAHEIQTNLIREEIEGNGEAVTLLMAHAQNHMNSALMMRDLAEEFITLYERISRLEGK